MTKYKSSIDYDTSYYLAVKFATSDEKNCLSLRYWIHSADRIRKGAYENSVNLVNGVGEVRGSSFIFQSWQRKRRLI